MIKISEEQAVRMARATILSDESKERIARKVQEIIEAWKFYGYIEGFEKGNNSTVDEERQ